MKAEVHKGLFIFALKIDKISGRTIIAKTLFANSK
jgi:hypothetical protein